MQLSFFLFLISYFKNKYKPFLTVENNRLNTQITKYNIENEINIKRKMKKQLIQKGIILVGFVLLSFQNLYSQDEVQNRFKLTLNTMINNQKNVLKIESFGYTIDQYKDKVDDVTIEIKDMVYIYVSGSETINKDFIKLFETKTQNINGYIEIKDTQGKIPTKKIEFKNSRYSLSENYSTNNYENPSSFSISIYTNDIIIDGASIYKK